MRLNYAFLTGLICLTSAAAHSADWNLVVSGLGGTDPYLEQFPEQAAELGEYLANVSDNQARTTTLIDDDATLEQIEASFASINENMASSDRFNLFLIGHGAFDGRDYKFNIPGPDLTGTGLAELLNSLKSDKQLVVVATSASGVLLEKMQSENRTLITATKSANERTAVRFGTEFIDALSSNESDINKDGLVDAQEAYDYALYQVEQHYEVNQLLASEHARIEGPSSNVYLGRLSTQLAADRSDPEIAGLVEERDQLEAKIAALRAERDQLDVDSYFDQLEPLMLELASVQSRIESKQESSEESDFEFEIEPFQPSGFGDEIAP